MCRLVAYAGNTIPLGRLIDGPEHSLVVQSYRPREMRSGVVNADGFGVGWFPREVDEAPALFTSPMPIWADANLPHLARAIQSACVFAAVRSATPGIPYGPEQVQPFKYGHYLFMHNGYITHFRQRLMRRLRELLRDEFYVAIAGGSDSEHIFALWLEHLAQVGKGPSGMVEALQRTLTLLHRYAREAGSDALLNLAMTDGRTLVTCRDTTTEYAPSLYITTTDPFFADAVVVASEPLFANDHWHAVLPGTVTVVGPALNVRTMRVEV
ncbi:MAG: ergothioneine biosynthesis protein EgtC [Candidatus Binatia bacterium]